MPDLLLYLAFGQQRGDSALHWILLAVPEGSDKCTYYHVTGGPTQGTAYKVEIQVGKRVNSHGIATKQLVGRIKEKDQTKLKDLAKRTEPKFCQRWVVDVLGGLEKKGLVQEGTYAGWYHQMQTDPYSNDGAPAQPAVSQATTYSTQPQTTTTWATTSSAAAVPVATTAATTSSTIAQPADAADSGWVWDETYSRYRRWDASSLAWVWN